MNFFFFVGKGNNAVLVVQHVLFLLSGDTVGSSITLGVEAKSRLVADLF